MPDRARFLQRGDDGDLTERVQGLGKRFEAIRVHAIVIGQQNHHRLEAAEV
jgi:hypothetical protein